MADIDLENDRIFLIKDADMFHFARNLDFQLSCPTTSYLMSSFSSFFEAKVTAV